MSKFRHQQPSHWCSVRKIRRGGAWVVALVALASLFGRSSPESRVATSGCEYLLAETRKACGEKRTSLGRSSSSSSRELLATGLGGSGTWRTALALTEAGLLVEHEGVGVDGSVSWLYAVASDEYPCGRANADTTTRFERVLHVVRCPDANVGTLSTHKRTTLLFAASKVGMRPPPPDERLVSNSDKDESSVRYELSRRRLDNPQWLRFLAELWVAWNERVERYRDALARLEDRDEGHALCEKAGIAVHNKTCTSTASRAAQAIGKLRYAARDYSNRFFRNGDYNPARCLRGDCSENLNDNSSSAAGLPTTTTIAAAATTSSSRSSTSTLYHHRRHAVVDWPRLRAACSPELVARIVRAATRYGYRLDGENCSVARESDVGVRV